MDKSRPSKSGRTRSAAQRVQLAVCRKAGEDLNAWLVANGWAVAYRRYGRDYIEQEKAARSARRGIWASEFMMPWDWRRR